MLTLGIRKPETAEKFFYDFSLRFWKGVTVYNKFAIFKKTEIIFKANIYELIYFIIADSEKLWQLRKRLYKFR